MGVCVFGHIIADASRIVSGSQIAFHCISSFCLVHVSSTATYSSLNLTSLVTVSICCVQDLYFVL